MKIEENSRSLASRFTKKLQTPQRRDAERKAEQRNLRIFISIDSNNAKIKLKTKKSSPFSALLSVSAPRR
jgi:hypothetical protein